MTTRSPVPAIVALLLTAGCAPKTPDDTLRVSGFVEATEVQMSSEAGGRVMLVDRLPAGLEIENPRLIDSGDISTFAWLKRDRDPERRVFDFIECMR